MHCYYSFREFEPASARRRRRLALEREFAIMLYCTRSPRELVRLVAVLHGYRWLTPSVKRSYQLAAERVNAYLLLRWQAVKNDLIVIDAEA